MDDETVEKVLEQIGTRLRELRKKKGYTSAESFAYDHDLPRVHYWRIESGKANLTIKTLQRILNIYDLTLAEFFREGERD